jgi:hypothetical protein
MPFYSRHGSTARLDPWSGHYPEMGRLVVAFGVADQVQRSQPLALSTALGYWACYSCVGAVLELKQS